MEKYIQQLLYDLEQIMLQRWRACPPHYFQAGMPSPFLMPSEGWEEEAGEDVEAEVSEAESDLDFDLTIAEMERWLECEHEGSMFSAFGLEPEQFPPLDRLSDEQVEGLTFALLRLWESFNFSASFPNKTPARILYPLLLERMLEGCMVLDDGHIGIEFCEYDPATCPFEMTYCDCREFMTR